MEDASTLRWILIIAGAALLGGLLLFGNPNRKPKTRRPRKRRPNRRKSEPTAASATRREPTLEAGEDAAEPVGQPSRFEDPSFGDAPPSDFSAGQGELPIDAAAGPALGDPPALEPSIDPPLTTDAEAAPVVKEHAGSAEPAEPAGPPPDPPEKVIVLYLRARDNRKVVGVELLNAAMKSGMEFGDMQIFHRLVEGQSQPVFSMANLENPGTFDKESWPTLETRGMTLFLGLPGPMPALDAWNAMVATSRRMAELLHLDVLDQAQAHFTRQREGEIREELREFERQQQPEG